MHNRWQRVTLAYSMPLAILVACSGGIDVTAPAPIKSIDRDAIDANFLSGAAPMVVAHRACWQLAPENSLAAVNECIALGVDMVELDVRRSADGVLVIMHDETVDRTTNGSGKVADLTYEAIQTLSLKEGDGDPDAAVTEESVPTLRAAMNVVKDKIMVNVDAKSDEFDDVVAELKMLGMLDHVVMKLEVPPNDAQLTNAPFIGQTHFMPKITQRGDALSATAPPYAFTMPVAFEVKFETEEYIIEGRDTIEGMGARLWANTLDPSKCAFHDDQRALQDPNAHWGRLLEIGVNMIQTDYPSALLSYLESRE